MGKISNISAAPTVVFSAVLNELTVPVVGLKVIKMYIANRSHRNFAQLWLIVCSTLHISK